MCDLTQPHFQDADKAREYLEALRWPEGPVCPHCGSAKAPMKLEGEKCRPGLYKCSEYGCRKQFTVTVKTVFERSRVPLNKWLMAVYLMCSSKKGISAHQLHRMLGVTYKTAWFMAHRIREAMREDGDGLLGGGGGTVEADETFWGNNKRRGDSKKGRGYAHKMKVFSLVERGGKMRSFHVKNVTASTLRPILKAQGSSVARSELDDGRSVSVHQGRPRICKSRRSSSQSGRVRSWQRLDQHYRGLLFYSETRTGGHFPPCRRAAFAAVRYGV